ncbi:hypothetical protein J6590_063050 [Homalodisca vitripennis]|nr:hypothetical protein J6590_063050 [Homalodisca vitripennis]
MRKTFHMYSSTHIKSVSACRLWNALPINIRAIDKRARFGAEVKALMLGAQGICIMMLYATLIYAARCGVQDTERTQDRRRH